MRKFELYVNKCKEKWSNITAIFVFILFLVYVSFYIIINAEWVLGDEYRFLDYSAIGKTLPMHNPMGFGNTDGRFQPLTGQIYNLLTLFPYGYTPTAHYILNAVLFNIMSITSVLVAKNLIQYYFKIKNIFIPIAIYILLFIGSSHIISFIDVIFQYNVISTFFVILLYLLLKFQLTNRVLYLYMSCPFVVWITYSTETMFISFVTIGIILLIFNSKFQYIRAIRYYSIFLILDALIFLTLYVVLVLPNVTTMYKHIQTDSSVIKLMIWAPQVLLIILLSGIRTIWLFVKRESSIVLIDAFLLSGGLICIASLFLKLSSVYCYESLMVFMLPTLAYWGFYYYHKQKYLFYVYYIILILLFIRPLHVFPYFIKNNQVRRTTEMENIKKVSAYIKKNDILYFLTSNVPKGTNDYNFHAFNMMILHKFITFESKRKIGLVEINSLTNTSTNYPYLFLIREDARYLDENNRCILKEKYDSIMSLGDNYCIFYKRKLIPLE